MTTTETPQLTAGTWQIDPAHSEVGFTVRHLGMSRVRGRFTSFSGSAQIAAEPTQSSVSATIELASVDTNNADRDAHLQGSDFFDAASNPQMTFVSTAVTESSLAGDLTVNGITKPVTLDLEVYGVTVDPYETTRAGFSATGAIKRSDFDISFNAPFGLDGALISDKVVIELEIQLVPAS